MTFGRNNIYNKHLNIIILQITHFFGKATEMQGADIYKHICQRQ